jgi:hypothetical protein
MGSKKRQIRPPYSETCPPAFEKCLSADTMTTITKKFTEYFQCSAY